MRIEGNATQFQEVPFYMLIRTFVSQESNTDAVHCPAIARCEDDTSRPEHGWLPYSLGGYSWRRMPLPAILCFCLSQMATTAATPEPTVRLATFGVGDTLLIVVIALIVFGPKKLPEISRQLGKLLYEFRKASNDFKFQIEEELRAAEQAERQKQLSTQAANPQPATPVTLAAGDVVSAESEGVRAPENLQPEGNEAATIEPAGQSATMAEEPQPLTIQPPSTGLPVSSRHPYQATVTREPEDPAAATGAGESLEEQQADAQAAIDAAAAEQLAETADSERSATTNPVPTHHG
jgi:sec-independent protein translocase protein TatB